MVSWPGEVRCHITDKKEMLRTIREKKELFIVVLKGHIPEDKFNCRTSGAVSDAATVLNFPPVYLNVDMVADEKTIGSKMYKYMKDNSIPTDRFETKLTQMLNTNGESFVISNYYLWFLLDNCYFKIDNIEEMFIFHKSTAFTNFTNEFMDKKTIAASEQEKQFYKMVMNSSYGSDVMNAEKFTKSRMINSDQAFIEHLSPNFVSTTLLTPDIKDSEGNIVKHAIYQVEKKPATFSCTSNLASFFYTLDNTKF
jgi:hypothetical protein